MTGPPSPRGRWDDTQRTGPFWDAVAGRAPLPKAAATLGLEVLAVDGDNGTIELAFTAVDFWTNPAGNVLGAFAVAMLYDTLGPALPATLGADEFQSTVQMSVTFLRPVRHGRLLGKGRVLHRHGDIAALEATLLAYGSVIATATALIIPLAIARSAV